MRRRLAVFRVWWWLLRKHRATFTVADPYVFPAGTRITIGPMRERFIVEHVDDHTLTIVRSGWRR